MTLILVQTFLSDHTFVVSWSRLAAVSRGFGCQLWRNKENITAAQCAETERNPDSRP